MKATEIFECKATATGGPQEDQQIVEAILEDPQALSHMPIYVFEQLTRMAELNRNLHAVGRVAPNNEVAIASLWMQAGQMMYDFHCGRARDFVSMMRRVKFGEIERDETELDTGVIL